MAVTLLPAGRSNIGNLFMRLRIGGMTILTAQAYNTMISTCNDATISQNEKVNRVLTILISQTFFH